MRYKSTPGTLPPTFPCMTAHIPAELLGLGVDRCGPRVAQPLAAQHSPSQCQRTANQVGPGSQPATMVLRKRHLARCWAAGGPPPPRAAGSGCPCTALHSIAAAISGGMYQRVGPGMLPAQVVFDACLLPISGNSTHQHSQRSNFVWQLYWYGEPEMRWDGDLLQTSACCRAPRSGSKVAQQCLYAPCMIVSVGTNV
jgi:hypothetical protein